MSRTDDESVAPRRNLGSTPDRSSEGSKPSMRERLAAATSRDSSTSGHRSTPERKRERDTDHGTKGKGGTGRSAAAGAAAGGAAGAATGRAASSRRTRKARLRLVQVDAWSVMKTAFLLSIAIAIVTVVAVFLIWTILGAVGVWDSINNMVGGAINGAGSQRFDITKYVGTGRVMGLTLIIAVLDIILITAIATLAAFLYNLAATLVGGVELTLAEDV